MALLNRKKKSDAAPRTSTRTPSTTDKKSSKPRRKLPIPKFLRRFGAYVAGSWYELRETRWPDRKTTWSMTSAVLIFTAAMMAFIIFIDFLFDQLFKRILQ